MTRELTMLVCSGLLSLALALATIGIHFRAFGGTMIRSNRGDYPALQGMSGRVVRAHTNLNEALLPFAIVVIAAQLLHIGTAVTAWAAITFFAARVAHAALYVAGVPEIRSVAYYIGLVATLTITVVLFL